MLQGADTRHEEPSWLEVPDKIESGRTLYYCIKEDTVQWEPRPSSGRIVEFDSSVHNVFRARVDEVRSTVQTIKKKDIAPFSHSPRSLSLSLLGSPDMLPALLSDLLL